MSARTWIVSELYYPEETSTGHLLTRIAEAIAEGPHDVRVICGQPTYSRRGLRAPRDEVRHGVHIHRCGSTTLDKDRLALRAINAVTLAVSILVTLLFRLGRGDLVFVVTNPPLLPFVARLAARLRGARVALIVHDVYPDALVAAGMMRHDAALTRFARTMTRRLYRAVEYVVVLGRDMEALVRAATRGAATQVVVIPNWADLEDVGPLPRERNGLLAEHGLQDRLVLQYAGNMGRTHDIESIVAAAAALRDEPWCHLLVVGWGAKEPLLRHAVQVDGLPNITLLGRLPRSAQPEFLNACDVALITFMPGMAGVSVPSRMYNVMAVGKPIIGMADPHSELALAIAEHDIGWVVAPGDVQGLVAAIREAAADPERLAAMGRRARTAALEHYSFDEAARRYRELVALDQQRGQPADRAGAPVMATSGRT